MDRYQTHESEETVIIEIGRSVALVLDSLLARWENSADEFVVHLDHDAEWHALLFVAGSLERQLADLVRPDYDRVLDQARKAIVEKWGTVDR